MALDVCGRHDASRSAYEHLLQRQGTDGAVPVDLVGGDGRVDTNAVAYVAAGLLHHTLSTGDTAFARTRFAFVERALAYVLDHRLDDGAVAWSVEADGTVATTALVAASSSIACSLRAGAGLAHLVGTERVDWWRAAAGVAEAVRLRRGPFLDKSEFAMDWYYPVLAGAVSGPAALAHLDAGRGDFLTPDGVRCRSDGRWVTTAESAEAAIAYATCGDRATAVSLVRSVADKRAQSGGYLTGLVYPERSVFPPGEESTYSAAAVLLAADLLAGGRATARVFAPARTSTRRLLTRAAVSATNSPDSIASR
jgi:hypothetical protein